METRKGPGPDDLTHFRQLAQDPTRYHLFHALRVLEARYRDAPRLGESRTAAQDRVRLGQMPELAFPPSTLSGFRPGKAGQPAKLSNLFFGLWGPHGPLPLHLTEYARDRLRNHRDPTLVAFADMLTHRVMTLFYRVWASSQPAAAFDRAWVTDDEEGDAWARDMATGELSLEGQTGASGSASGSAGFGSGHAGAQPGVHAAPGAVRTGLAPGGGADAGQSGPGLSPGGHGSGAGLPGAAGAHPADAGPGASPGRGPDADPLGPGGRAEPGSAFGAAPQGPGGGRSAVQAGGSGDGAVGADQPLRPGGEGSELIGLGGASAGPATGFDPYNARSGTDWQAGAPAQPQDDEDERTVILPRGRAALRPALQGGNPANSDPANSDPAGTGNLGATADGAGAGALRAEGPFGTASATDAAAGPFAGDTSASDPFGAAELPGAASHDEERTDDERTVVPFPPARIARSIEARSAEAGAAGAPPPGDGMAAADSPAAADRAPAADARRALPAAGLVGQAAALMPERLRPGSDRLDGPVEDGPSEDELTALLSRGADAPAPLRGDRGDDAPAALAARQPGLMPRPGRRGRLDLDLDFLQRKVAALSGYANSSMLGSDEMPDLSKRFFAGLMSSGPKNADGLRAILSHFFEAKFEIQQFVGHWLTLEQDDTWQLGATGLGRGTSIGRRVWSRDSKFRILIGPLDLKDYQRLLPGRGAIERMEAIVRNYVGDRLAWDVQLILKADQVPKAVLGQSVGLGYNSWIGSREAVERDADDLILTPPSQTTAARALAGH